MHPYSEIKEQIQIHLKEFNFKELIMRIFIVLGLIGSCLAGCSYLNRQAGLDNDNFIEEVVEELIENETGWDIDLTPFD